MRWRQNQGSIVFYAHFPKDRNCDSCLRTKITRAPHRGRTGEAAPRAEKIGDLVTADHKVFDEEGESRNNHRCAVVVQDLATRWIQAHPCKTKDFSGDGKEFTKNFLSRHRSQKSFIRTTRWNLGKHVRFVMESPHFNTSSIRDEWHRRESRSTSKKEGTSAGIATGQERD